MSLTRAQVDQLLEPIRPNRVFNDRQGHSHIAGFDADAHLTRIFGFGGWEKRVLSLEVVHERSTEPQPKPGSGGTEYDQGRWWVTYACTLQLTVKDPDGNVVGVYEDAATGSAQNMPSPAEAYDFAIKNAVTYALKRCAKDLGDQFGLSLYNKGQTKGLVVKTLVMPTMPGATVVPTPEEDLQSHAPVPQSMGNDELDDTRPFTDDA